MGQHFQIRNTPISFSHEKNYKKTQLSIYPNSTRRDLFKTGVDVPVGAREPSEVKTPEIPRRRATSKIADAYLYIFASKPRQYISSRELQITVT